ncbi:MAG TPA: glycosyltransferase [Longimicrobiales bacterium]
MHAPDRDPLIVVMPVMDDWASVRLLLPELDRQLAGERNVHVLCVDDGSETEPAELVTSGLTNIERVDVLRLARNLGHQRAIACALCHVATTTPHRALVVMDSDGEDAPADVPRLLSRFAQENGAAAVFAKRIRRSEGPIFSLFYWLYRQIHYLLTGIRVQVGNFSVIPPQAVRRLITMSELWNHYAAAVFRSRTRLAFVPTSRSVRLVGRSRMGFVSLVAHGMGAMSVFADRIGVRLLAASALAGVILVLTFMVVAIVKFFTTAAIPGWATTAAGVIVILLVQTSSLALIFAFMIQHARSGGDFIPIRDYVHFVARITCCWERDGSHLLSR